MIRVTIELVSVITGRTTVIGQARIANTGGGTPTRGNYRAYFWGKRNRKLKKGYAELDGFPRKQQSVWVLLERLLKVRK